MRDTHFKRCNDILNDLERKETMLTLKYMSLKEIVKVMILDEVYFDCTLD